MEGNPHERDGRTARSAESDRSDALDRRELQNRAIKGATWTIIHALTSVPIAFGTNLLLARVLGVVDYGRLAFLLTLMNVAGGIVALGVTTGTIQFGAKAHAAGRREEVRNLLSQAQGFRLLVAAPVLTLVVCLAARVPWEMLLVALAFGIWIPCLFDGATTCLAIENKTDAGAKNALIVNLMAQAGVITSLLVIGTADAVWVTRLAIGGLGVGLALIVIDPSYRRSVIRPRVPTAMPPGFWAFAVPTALASVVATLVLSRTEVFVLNWMGDAAAVGVFALAFGLASHTFAPAQAIVGPLVPAISGLREVDTASMTVAFRRTMRTSALLVGGLCVVGVPILAILTPWLYGEAYSAAAPMFVVLSISAGLLVASAPVSAFVMGRLAARTLLIVNLVALVVDVATAVALVPLVGPWGAVVANVAGSLTQLGLLLHSELRAAGMSWPEVLRVTAALRYGVVVCVFTWATSRVDGLPFFANVILAPALGMAVWILTVRVTRAGLHPADADAVLRALPSAVRRPAALLASVLTSPRPAEDC